MTHGENTTSNIQFPINIYWGADRLQNYYKYEEHKWVNSIRRLCNSIEANGDVSSKMRRYKLKGLCTDILNMMGQFIVTLKSRTTH